MFELALFPLHTVLFPGMPLQLHIFEPRYRLMVRRCLENNLSFGVVLIRQGLEALGPLAEPYQVGCTARIVEIEKAQGENLYLTALGDEPFRIIELDKSQPYLVGQVEALRLERPHTLEILRQVRALTSSVKRYLKLLSQARISALNLSLTDLELPDDPMMLIYLAASLLQLPSVEKQPLLEVTSTLELITEIQRLYQRETAVLMQLSKVDEARSSRASWLN
jgi:Lon protease-like protein